MLDLAPRKPRKRTETTTLTEIRSVLSRLPYVTIQRNNSGALKDETGRLVRYGLGEGSADLVGVVTVGLGSISGPIIPVGIALAIEVKAPGKKPTAQQIAWLAHYKSRGAIVGVAESVEDAMRIIRDGLEEFGVSPWGGEW